MSLIAPMSISAVDPATDQLTIAGHGRSTGDGAAAIYAAHGGSVPGGLAAVTDYWLIVVDANTVKLASSSANALAGTAINITSAGAGSLYLLLGIPYRVATQYTAGVSQVKAADLKALQEAQVALWNFLTGQTQTVWKRGPRTTTVGFPSGACAVVQAGTISSNTGAGAKPGAIFAVSTTALLPINLPDAENERAEIIGVTLHGSWTGTGNITTTLYMMDYATNILIPLGSTTSSAINSAIAVNVTAPTTITPGNPLYLSVATAGTNSGTALSVEILSDVPN